jgi:uncharacterized membrane protein YccC
MTIKGSEIATMKIFQPLLVVRIMLSILVVSTFSACDNTAATIRRVTYPPDFTYVSGQQLRSRMSQLAFQLQLLDEALAESNNQQQVQQQQVVSILGNIGRIGSNLQANDAGSNHPFLQNQMRSFVSDVGEARVAASLNPPSFYLAGRIAGGCVNCHSVNR